VDSLDPDSFQPAWWCRGAHAQTLWPYVFRLAPRPAFRRQRLELPDGDFLDLDWAGPDAGPLVLALHGLEGSSNSHYLRGLAHTLALAGIRTVVMHFRGCSGEPNRLARAYHSGETGDVAQVVQYLHAREPGLALAAVGYSLGGNVLLKWLGEGGEDIPLRAAVAVSVPYDLAACARRLEHGLSRLYQWRLVRSLKRATRRKFSRIASPVPLAGLDRVRTFTGFDDLVTAPLHGFSGAAEYYARCSCRQFLPGVRIPTLLVHAADDPFMSPGVVPQPAELPAAVALDLSPRGGHVGFIAGANPLRPRYWLERRIEAFLGARLVPA